MGDEAKTTMKAILIVISTMLGLAIIISAFISLTGCTLSFSNVDTHGSASDLIDEQQAASPNVNPQVTVPTSLIPK